MYLMLSTPVTGGITSLASVLIGKIWKQFPAPTIRLAVLSVFRNVLTVCFNIFGIAMTLGII